MLHSILNHESTVRDWMEEPRGKRALAPLFPQITAKMQNTFGGGDDEIANTDPTGFLMDLPLPDLLHFLDFALPTSSEDTVDSLLAQLI
jgi:beta-glucosidase